MDVLSFVIVGHVDHGKSTLIGRLLYDTDSLAPSKIEEIRKASDSAGRQTEFAYLLDHLQEERKQGITIDTTQVFFETATRRYVIIDAPGHVEFVRNMITGASQAEAAVLIVDATEGVAEQTKRHSYMLALLGLKQVVVVLNKVDLIDFSRERLEAVERDVQVWLDSVGISPSVYIPISALGGDNVAARSTKMDWYDGPTFLESLDTLAKKQPPEDKPLLFPVQDVYKIDDKRINVGRVESGVLEQGMEIKILPSGERTTVESVERFLEGPRRAIAGECVGVTTTARAFLDRGAIACVAGAEPGFGDRISANIFWMSKSPLTKDQKLTIRCATQETRCAIEQIKKRINSSTLAVLEENAQELHNLEVGEVVIRTKKPIATKDFNDVQELGRFVLVRDENTCAGGVVIGMD